MHFFKTAWFRYAAAILIFIGIGSVIYLLNTQKDNPAVVHTRPVPNEKIDVLPGGNKAVLILGDESVMNLDSLKNGSSIKQGGMQIIKSAEGEILYLPLEDDGGGAVYMNTMKTPRGGQYQLSLPDGTQVWLNSASSITYPTVFRGDTRKVSVSGEVYFDVKKEKSRPFIVSTVKDNITVLGTAFNVNTYPNEPISKTSLISGSVRVNDKILQPGQAYVNGKIITTNVEQDVAWKNGVFNFSNTSLEAAMRQVERWYDVEVRFEGKIPAMEFQGELPRDYTLQELLAAFAFTGVKYTISGKQLIISP